MCGGHVDGTKLKVRTCPGSFQCKILSENSCKLIKVSPVDHSKSETPGKPGKPVMPAGSTAAVIPPVAATVVETVTKEEEPVGVAT